VINHDILLKKLSNYGIHGIGHDWFEHYLSDRQQFVEVSGTVSDFTIGIPQGYILARCYI